MDLDAAVAAIVDRLKAAGVRACTDERDLNPPAVWVGPPILAFRFGKGFYDAEYHLFAAVPNTGRDTANKNLGALITAVQDALAGAVVTGRPIDLTVPDAAVPLPAYDLTFTARINA